MAFRGSILVEQPQHSVQLGLYSLSRKSTLFGTIFVAATSGVSVPGWYAWGLALGSLSFVRWHV